MADQLAFSTRLLTNPERWSWPALRRRPPASRCVCPRTGSSYRSAHWWSLIRGCRWWLDHCSWSRRTSSLCRRCCADPRSSVCDRGYRSPLWWAPGRTWRPLPCRCDPSACASMAERSRRTVSGKLRYRAGITDIPTQHLVSQRKNH